MKTILTLIFSFLSLTAAAQVEQDNKQKIQQVLNTFMRCISNKDSTTFYSFSTIVFGKIEKSLIGEKKVGE